MQKYYDYHTHSTISFDALVSMEDSCSLALARGAAGLTFTEHVELYADNRVYALPDTAAYNTALAAAKQRFPQLELGQGLEINLCPEHRRTIEEYLRGDWDFVLGAVHELGNLSAYNGEYTAGKSKQQAYRGYFAGVYERVKAMPCFDVLAHAELIRRDRRFNDAGFNYDEYADLWDPVLRLLIERGQGLEVNTAGWRYLQAEAHPGLPMLRRYRQLGGEIITCGSDAHTAGSGFFRIREGYAFIKEAGFDYITLYEGRKPRQMKLEI